MDPKFFSEVIPVRIFKEIRSTEGQADFSFWDCKLVGEEVEEYFSNPRFGGFPETINELYGAMIEFLGMYREVTGKPDAKYDVRNTDGPITQTIRRSMRPGEARSLTDKLG
ncbi:hypothetical protein HOG16_02970 [Candidatus Woesearchaeota archaeon]|jgi:hypothetical protein|nr:hypothetical protein [Candidatus Woesearchaeota archaeon]MBT4322294.1 hypothetical protein [Candidatus Woesearchaeota archaeon]MBT4630863.1 hypothetical protein [Candidatus Woesearchaeota archaeon]